MIIAIIFFVDSACCATSRPGIGHSKKSGRGRCQIVIFFWRALPPATWRTCRGILESFEQQTVGIFFRSFASPFSSIQRAAPHLVLVQAILRKVDAAGAEFCFFCAHAAAHHVANISPLSGDLCKQIFRAFFLRHGFACSYRELHRRAWIEERDACL